MEGLERHRCRADLGLRPRQRRFRLGRDGGDLNPRPLDPLPDPITDPGHLARLTSRRRDRLAGITTSTSMRPDLRG
jgi:hypothetical protein